MSRSVTFAGQTIFKPGGLTRVRAGAGTPVGLSQVGIIAILGEAEGGAPGSVGLIGDAGVAGVVQIDDPALAKQLFKNGPLADAIRLAFDSSVDPAIPGGAFRVMAYKTNQSLQALSTLPSAATVITGTSTGASTSSDIVWTGGGLTLNAHKGRWLLWSGQKRRIVSNTATDIIVSPPFNGVPQNLDALSILSSQIIITSKDYGAHTNQISVDFDQGVVNTQAFVVVIDASFGKVEQSPEIGGNPFLILEYGGGPIFENGNITTITSSIVTFTPAGGAPILNAFAGMILEFPDGTRRLIQGNTAATPTAVTLDSGHVLSAAQVAAFGAGTHVNVRNVTSATASIVGSAGVATSLTSTVAPTADNLNITFPAGMTLRQLVDQINGTTNYVATVPPGVNPDTTLMSSFDFNARNTSVDVRFDQGITPTTKGNFRRDLQVLVDWINNFSEQATAAKSTGGAATEGAGIPSFTGGTIGAPRSGATVFLAGGARGVSTNTNFQNAFDALAQVRANHIAPLVSQDGTADGLGSTYTFASVAAQLQSHVDFARAVGRSERGGYIGGHLTKAGLIAQAALFNDTDVQIFGQKPVALDVDGNLVQMPEWAQAVQAASMRSGADEIGEPLTFKFIKTSGLSQDATWSTRSKTDIDALIGGGVMFAEQLTSGGFRWVRDITTHLIDDNDLFVDGSSRDAVRFVAYDLRTSLENKFTGKKATPANVANIREFVAAKMGIYRQESIIVDSLDPETQTTIVPGFRRLRVSIVGNTATIRVEIFPVTGIVFELTDITLQLPILSA